MADEDKNRSLANVCNAYEGWENGRRENRTLRRLKGIVNGGRSSLRARRDRASVQSEKLLSTFLQPQAKYFGILEMLLTTQTQITLSPTSLVPHSSILVTTVCEISSSFIRKINTIGCTTKLSTIWFVLMLAISNRPIDRISYTWWTSHHKNLSLGTFSYDFFFDSFRCNYTCLEDAISDTCFLMNNTPKTGGDPLLVWGGLLRQNLQRRDAGGLKQWQMESQITNHHLSLCFWSNK